MFWYPVIALVVAVLSFSTDRIFSSDLCFKINNMNNWKTVATTNIKETKMYDPIRVNLDFAGLLDYLKNCNNQSKYLTEFYTLIYSTLYAFNTLEFNLTCSLMKMLIKARKSVTTRLILPGMAVSGITKLVCDTRTMIADGR